MSTKARQKAIPHEKKMRDLVARIDQMDDTQPKKTMKLLHLAAEEASDAQLEFQAYLIIKRCWDLEKLTKVTSNPLGKKLQPTQDNA